MAKVTPFACAAALATAKGWGERAEKAMGVNSGHRENLPGLRKCFYGKERDARILHKRVQAESGNKKGADDDDLPDMQGEVYQGRRQSNLLLRGLPQAR